MYATATNRLSGRVPLWVAAGLALCVALTAASPATAATGTDRQGAGHVRGWTAGTVAAGTGYRTHGGSKRVREVQRGLHRLGYPVGPVDGLFGPLTDRAVRRYQSDRELTADGVVGSRTLGSLRARTETAGNNRQAERKLTRSRSRAGAATSARVASSPARPQVGSPVARSEGLDGLPSWWMLLIIVPLAFSAAVMAALMLVRGPSLAQAGAGAVRRRVLRTRDPERGDQPASGAVYVEGQSPDPRVGPFRGFAYWMWPVAAAGNGDREPTLLVYDPSKRGPVSARTEDVTSVNGQAVEPRARARTRRPKFRWVGARVYLAEQAGVQPLPGTISVDLELFAEGEHDRWDAGPGRRPRPVHVRMDDLEAGVERTVMTERLPELAAALERRGMHMAVEDLRRLPFAMELTLEVEFALAGREVAQAKTG
jgi:hypothetical protein